MRGDQLRLCIDSGATRGCLPVELGHLIPDELVTNWHPTNVVKSAQSSRAENSSPEDRKDSSRSGRLQG
eukprot:4099474-Prymnesium_polylepis.1